MKLICLIISIAIVLSCTDLRSQDLENITKEKIWNWSGSVGANANFYTVSGIPKRSNPFFWNTHAQFTGKVLGFELPFSFSYGHNNISFTRPFLQAGMSPSYKWAKLHIGTRNMFFSPYTLAGHTFNGVGVELAPGNWRISAMKGTFRRARELNENLDPRFYNYLYKRSGHAFKLGYGNATTHFDLSYLYGKDDPNSIDFDPPVEGVKPSENHVIGFSGAVKITNSLNYFASGGLSLFTRNINSTEAEDFPTEKLADLFKTKISTRLNYAFRTGFDFKYRRFKLRTSYERIMPEFETMGAFFFVNDRENITIAPGITMFKNQLNLNGNLGIQRNNLLGNRSETTSRLIGSLNVAYFHPKAWGINFNYTNFSTEQTQAAIALSDSVRVALVTTNISLTPTYSWSTETKVNSLVLSGNYQQVNDRNPFTREFTNMNTSFYNANYNIQWVESGWGMISGLNYNIIELASFTTTRYGLTGGITKNFAENKINFAANMNYNLSKIEEASDGAVITISSNISYALSEKQSFSFFINILRNESKQFQNYTEILGGLSYIYRFR